MAKIIKFIKYNYLCRHTKLYTNIQINNDYRKNELLFKNFEIRFTYFYQQLLNTIMKYYENRFKILYIYRLGTCKMFRILNILVLFA